MGKIPQRKYKGIEVRITRMPTLKELEVKRGKKPTLFKERAALETGEKIKSIIMKYNKKMEYNKEIN